jgi:hypothetical protein
MASRNDERSPLLQNGQANGQEQGDRDAEVFEYLVYVIEKGTT